MLFVVLKTSKITLMSFHEFFCFFFLIMGQVNSKKT